jgi:hypothetical protein
MASTPANRQSNLVYYLIMLLGFVLGYFYNSSLDPSASVPVLDAKYEATSLKGLEGLKIDYSVLTMDQFTGLRVFGSLPVTPTGGGSTDPFQ